MIKKFFQKMKKHIQEVLKIKESPQAIAAGFTLATIIALLPTFGLGIFIGLGLILIFNKMSKVSMVGGFVFWNPIITGPFYTLSYFIGDLLFNRIPNLALRFELREALYIYSIKFLLGNIIIVISIGFLSYFVIKAIATRYQKQYKTYLANPLERGLIEPIEELI